MSEYLHDAVSGSLSLAEVVANFYKILTGIDRRLGYHGQERFVAFYHEPRALEVLWRDRRSYGFATGAWITFMDDIAPLAGHYKVNVGCHGTAATHVLFVDRSAQTAYFAERTHAVQFLADIANDQPNTDRDLSGYTAALKPMIEITHAQIDGLARKLWKNRAKEDSISSDWSGELAEYGISIASAIHLP